MANGATNLATAVGNSTDSIIQSLIGGYVAIETARMNSSLQNAPAEQQQAINQGSVPVNVNAPAQPSASVIKVGSVEVNRNLAIGVGVAVLGLVAWRLMR